jgi:hypothetical protein
MGKANAALPARANRKAMVRAARRLHFRYDLRLAEAQSNRAYHPAEQENNGELNKKLNSKMHVVHGLTYAASTFAE